MGAESDRNAESSGNTEKLEKPIDWRQWWKDAGAMGIQPSELNDLTPYEFNLMREGYHKNMESLWDIAKFQAWVVYASGCSAAGQTPKPIDQWLEKSPDVPSNTPREQEIDADYKAEMEAKMNIRK
ncbi:hypothetical protein L0657_06780 [Dyadobacter sp. CY345]|uniref:hypothetical protein n=1 Tax=Dyadobacter sp. CY345 TaxID=2909335 RepID=UPI001F4338CD|nr:hypothetical protein [Dyadobacter sp. CY345]MCF2443655.1 hypothetical protein [Dyadobacter sp. CY345]